MFGIGNIINLTIFCNLLIIAAFAAPISAQEEKVIIKYNQYTPFENDTDLLYFISLLKLSLDETVDDFGEYQLVPVNINMTQQRSIAMLQSGEEIDVVWTITSIERESIMQAVYFPLLKGLMGNRVFLIRETDQTLFDKINTLNDLSSFTAGQGSNWPDTQIIKSNNLPIQTAPDELLFKMLLKNRFDYFPRAITEVIKENKIYPEFSIEKKLMFQYLSPIYFFVNKNNIKLAKRIEVGLFRALESGKFDHLLQNSINITFLRNELDLDNRMIFRLQNLSVSEKTKALHKKDKLWLFN
ncbi:MAG: hypothetical protein KC484_06210 [Colwelliaceae bacterium]|nr:hypothetical protein [Colwelliaceae bacterium]